MEILKVGNNKEYSTVQAAVTAAVDDDIVLIYPGNYEEEVVIQKRVHLRGNTKNVSNGDVTITSDNSTPLSINCNTTTTGIIYIENIKLITDSTSSIDGSFKVVSADEALYIKVNRCSLHATNNSGDSSNIYIGDPVFCGGVSVSYCYLYSNNFHTKYLENVNVSSLIKTECNYILQSYYGCPTVDDTVYTPTYGYGTDYGSNLITPYMYYFSGYTKKLGIPVSRVVKAFTEDKYEYSPVMSESNYTCIAEETSVTGTGYFYLQTTFSGAHQIICEDDKTGVKYNDLIYSDVYPSTVSGFTGLP